MTPFIGQAVRWSSIMGDHELTGMIKHVDQIKRKVLVIDDDNDKTVEVHFESLRPANNFRNFLHLIDEWNAHYNKSDDSKVYEEGKDIEQALIKMSLSMNVRDKLSLDKIVLIKQLSHSK